MPRSYSCALILTIALPFLAIAQQPVDPNFMHNRILAIVPMVGNGKSNDPVRPMFAPNPAANRKKQDTPADIAKRISATGIIRYQFWLSDDGKSALVEFVASDPAALAPIINSRLPGVKVFERDKSSKGEVDREFKKLKRDFDINSIPALRIGQ